MGRLVYSMITSLDGYVADEHGIDWIEPGEQAHLFVNERSRSLGTAFMGRRMYEVMKVWQSLGTEPGTPAVYADYGEIWRAMDKVVYSTTLGEVETPRTRLERDFDADSLRAYADGLDHDASIDGPMLAAQALRAGIVDALEVYMKPVVVGSGVPLLPAALRLDLTLRDERRFDDGMVFLAYDIRRG